MKKNDSNSSRRKFTKMTILSATAGMMPAISIASVSKSETEFPLIDFHVHLSDDFTIEKAVALANKRDMKFGIVDHPGSKRIRTNEGLEAYIEGLNKYPVFIGLQPTNLNWTSNLSKDLLRQVDYVLMDADTIPLGNGKKLLLYNNHNYFEDPEKFMELYMEHIENILKYEPINIFGRPTFLPINFARYYDTLWTNERMMKIITLAGKRNIALEIQTPTHLPDKKFIKMAKAQGIKFTFGTNARNDNAGKLHYGLQMVKECGLTKDDMFFLEPNSER
jgi:histidinol phosphatase-like PHP family hydrolase